MLRRVSRMVAGRIFIVTTSLMLATAGLGALTVAPAGAASACVSIVSGLASRVRWSASTRLRRSPA